MVQERARINSLDESRSLTSLPEIHLSVKSDNRLTKGEPLVLKPTIQIHNINEEDEFSANSLKDDKEKSSISPKKGLRQRMLKRVGTLEPEDLSSKLILKTETK